MTRTSTILQLACALLCLSSALAEVALVTLTVTPSVNSGSSISEVHVGEPVTLTATAYNATTGGSPVEGVKVCLFWAGQVELQHFRHGGHRHPGNPQNLCTGVNGTDANGRYTVTLTSYKPGPMAIVAGALTGPGANQLSPVSKPVHIYFFGHSEDWHRHDRKAGWWRVEGYATAAIKKALETLSPSSQTKTTKP